MTIPLHSLDVPGTAIRAFERLHRLRVTVHDLCGSLWPILEPERFKHTQPSCIALKSWGHEPACFKCDVELLRRVLSVHPEGVLKVCHARLLEWAVPIFHGETLTCVLFAGVRRPPKDPAQYSDEIGAGLMISPAPRIEAGLVKNFDLPAVSADEAALVLEHLRQLAARLRMWELDSQTPFQAQPRRSPPSSALAVRQIAITRFVAAHHAENVSLGQLAAHLGLSESRVSHAVRECCGASWQELIAQARLRTAMGLLRHTSLAVSEVALRSGFADARQLHRAFAARVNTTPGRYRRDSRA